MPTIIIALLAVAGLIFSGTLKTGSEFIDGLKFQTKPNLPSISKGNLIFPLTVSVLNPSNISMPLDSIFASIYRKEGDEWKYIGSSQPDLTNVVIQANSETKMNFKIQIPLLDSVTEILNLTSLLNPNAAKNTYKAEVRIGVEGRTVTQNMEMQV